MIVHVSGDILLSKAQVLAHGVAANDPMTQGLALAIHENYPSLHRDYHHWCHTTHPKAGSAWMWGGPGGVRIVQLITQEGGYGQGARPGKATLQNVRASLRELAKMVKDESFRSIALPRLATGVGGLDWEDVSPIVDECLADVGVPVIVYSEYVAGNSADERLS